MFKRYKILFAISAFAIVLPNFASALQMPKSGDDLADMAGLSAQAYTVRNAKTGEVLISHNADMPMTPASLTKLVTAMVVLDSKVKLNKAIAITSYDQDLGACGKGGSCIKAVPGVTFTIDGLFHAALLPSANNAASALARSTGLSASQFAAKMNAKAKALGATGSTFYEPTGMDERNVITAADYSKIVTAAFENPYLRKIAGLNTYSLKSVNNPRKFTQLIKNTDKLLAEDGIQILGAKTGYLDSYNFAALLKYNGGPELAVVVLGEPHMYSAFDETKLLTELAHQSMMLGLLFDSWKKM